jgi:O-antigen/teichoic acid export membrane protein
LKPFFLKDVSVISIAQLIAGAAAFAYTIIAARFLGVENYGLFQALMALFGTLSVMSLPLNLATVHCVGVTESAHKRAVAGEFIRIAFIGGCTFTGIVVLCAPWIARMAQSSTTAPVIGMALLLTLRPVLTAFYGALQGNNRHQAYSISKISESFICFASGTLLILFGAGASGAILGYVIALGAVALFYFTQRDLYEFKTGFSHVKQEFQSVSKILIAFGVFLFIDNAPIVLGRARLSSELSGYFGALYNLRNVLFPFAFAISVPFYSRTLAHQSEGGMLAKALGLVAILGGVFIAAGYLGGEWLIDLIYGSEFRPAAAHMAYFGCSLFLQMITLVLIFHFSAKRRLVLFFLVIPLLLVACLLGMSDVTITRLITVQIIGWVSYLMCVAGSAVLSKVTLRRS